MVYIDYLNADKIDELGTVWINGEEFKGIGYNGLLTVNTKTYVSEPTRANDGSMPNIGDHETFIVPRCKINFKYLNVNDYRRLCNAILPNEFLVKYYDKDLGDFVEHWMYCEPQEMSKIYNVGTAVIGVLDYEVSFIGTLNKLKELTVQYDIAGEMIIGYRKEWDATQTYYFGEKVTFGGEYYEAIFYEDTFVGKPTYNPNYWVKIDKPLDWDSGTYGWGVGEIAYTKTTTNGKTEYRYYECIKGNARANLDNKEYWKQINITSYSNTEEYKLKDYVFAGTEGTDVYYKAIFYVDDFKDTISPSEDSKHWRKAVELNPKTVKWGQSIIIADQLDFLYPPTNYKSANKWQVYRKQQDGTYIDTTNYYSANQNVSILQDIKLKPVWE